MELQSLRLEAAVKIIFKLLVYKGKQKKGVMEVSIAAIYSSEEEKLSHICHKYPKRNFRFKRYCKVIWSQMGYRAAFQRVGKQILASCFLH